MHSAILVPRRLGLLGQAFKGVPHCGNGRRISFTQDDQKLSDEFECNTTRINSFAHWDSPSSVCGNPMLAEGRGASSAPAGGPWGGGGPCSPPPGPPVHSAVVFGLTIAIGTIVAFALDRAGLGFKAGYATGVAYMIAAALVINSSARR